MKSTEEANVTRMELNKMQKKPSKSYFNVALNLKFAVKKERMSQKSNI